MEIFTGSKQFIVQDQTENISFPVLVQYPTLKLSTPTAFGPYTMDVSLDAKILDGRFPLIIISHGNGGSHLLYRTISTHLAKNGYIVAMLEHYGNNRNNNELEETMKNLLLRPRHISLTIDLLLKKYFGSNIAEDKIGLIGHSMGGYAALALAGGIPRTKEGEIIKVTSDKRVKAIVLLAPSAGWFFHSPNKITIPILAFTAEHDLVTPPTMVKTSLESATDQPLLTCKEIKGAGHFSFLSPFPIAMNNPNFPPSTDPKGFDREKFHQELPKDILNFLNEKLGI